MHTLLSEILRAQLEVVDRHVRESVQVPFSAVRSQMGRIIGALPPDGGQSGSQPPSG